MDSVKVWMFFSAWQLKKEKKIKPQMVVPQFKAPSFSVINTTVNGFYDAVL